MTLPDSIAYPEVSDSKYPYTPDGDRRFLEDKPFLDPFCLASALGAVTTQLRFHTFVVKLPIRHPVLVAKQVASVAALTSDRFSFGVGLSPWPEDYRLAGVAWDGRGRRMDEMLAVMRGLLRGGYFHFEGERFRVESVKICPVPARPVPHPARRPLGGRARPGREARRRLDARRRRRRRAGAARRASARAAREARSRRETLRDPRAVEGRYSPDGVRRLEDLGVTDAIVGFRNAYEPDTMPLEKKLAAIRRLGEKVIRP